MLCPDATSELADISFGDAWKFGRDDKIGSSLIIVRTPVGLELVDAAMSQRKTQLSEVSPQSVVDSAIGMLKSKKKQFVPCRVIARISKQEVPLYSLRLPENNALDFGIAFLRFSWFLWPIARYTQLLPSYVPFSLLRMYQKAIAALFRL